MMPLQSDNRPDTAMPWQTRAANAGMAAALCLIALAGNAAPVTVRVTDSTGQPLPDAVVYAEPAGGQSLPKQLKPAEIEQRKRAFLPLVTVVQTGTSISFPNNDSVRHHVYSFSPPKTFELKLYSGVPAMPVVFDKPGTVVIGCNIHDRMTAYIHVVPTPHFAKTDAAGLARIEGMAAGKYRMKAWHFSLQANAPVAEQPMDFAGSEASMTLKINGASGAAIN